MVVLINGYTSFLTAILAVPKYDSIIKSLEELAAHSHFKLTLQTDSFLMNQIMVHLP